MGYHSLQRRKTIAYSRVQDFSWKPIRLWKPDHLPSLPPWPFPSVMQGGTWRRADYNNPLPPSKAAFPFPGLYPNSTVMYPAVLIPKHQIQTIIPHFTKAKDNQVIHVLPCVPWSLQGRQTSLQEQMSILQFLNCLIGLSTGLQMLPVVPWPYKPVVGKKKESGGWLPWKSENIVYHEARGRTLFQAVQKSHHHSTKRVTSFLN